MSNFEIGFEPKLTFLSDEDKKKLYTSALKIIEETGMLVLHDGAVKLLKDAGCSVEETPRGDPRIASVLKNM